MDSFKSALDSHIDMINRTNTRLNFPSTHKQLLKCKEMCMRGKNLLFIDNRLEYPQEALNILESDLKNLRDRYDLLIQRIDHQISSLQDDECSPDSVMVIPKELNTDKAKQLLERAVKAGLIDDTNGYKWLESDTLLAYFVEKSSDYLGLSKGEYQSVEGKNKTESKKRISWKPFEALFKLKGGKLRNDKKNYYLKENDWLPTGHEKIDALFDEKTGS